jgi:hypothetical protein
VDLSGGHVVSVRVAVIDLSGSGVGVVASRALAPGSTLGLSLPFPGGDVPVQTQARVVWSAPLGRFWRSGLAFTRVAHDQEAVLLRQLLAEDQHWRRLRAPD